MDKVTQTVLDVYNMPKNTLYQFSSDGSYVWKVDRYSTLNGDYTSDVPSEFVEVYTIDEKGNLICQWSGGLIGDLTVFDTEMTREEGSFGIFSYDMDMGKVFTADIPLQEAPIELSEQLEVPENKTPWRRYL